MIEAPVSRRGPFALWRGLGRGWFLGDLSAGSQMATRRQARRFAQTGMECPEEMHFAFWLGVELLPIFRIAMSKKYYE
ncbi:hypothetical protein P73_4809 (plasmid) [Celeribacter indicus]|uniref:Uncharacterized protein n=1 Tax=Celeribacter indicus TaxID=1208324 RepID=A0A0B5E2K2_9RHOB|nr:hypothetical protein P73_4809 [Celeribacter indicus]